MNLSFRSKALIAGSLAIDPNIEYNQQQWPAQFQSTITNKERAKRKKAKKQQKLSRRINRLRAA